ncbi:MAG: GTP-binding protein [Anaerolineae bacterium]|nr:GTP-binding protein [Anaerolineae bacterium]
MQTAKIIVVGPFASGKTTFIHSLSEIGVVPTESQRLGLEMGRYTVDDDLVIYLFDTPGSRRFEFAWDINYSRDLLGYVIVINSSHPKTFAEAENMLNLFRRYSPAPFVVAANGQDIKGALAPDDLRQALKQPETVKFISCVATDAEKVKKVLLGLMYEIFDRVNVKKQGG